MNLNDAKTLANELMNQHGLYDWTFMFDDAKLRFGQCRHRSKEISLSRELTELNDVVHVKDTILHEIAHALLPRGTHQ